jgi:MbtH protein
MSDQVPSNAAVYNVVVNEDEQYSIWAVDTPMAPGWSPVGMQGAKEACLDYIKEVWTDMRP